MFSYYQNGTIKTVTDALGTSTFTPNAPPNDSVSSGRLTTLTRTGGDELPPAQVTEGYDHTGRRRAWHLTIANAAVHQVETVYHPQSAQPGIYRTGEDGHFWQYEFHSFGRGLKQIRSGPMTPTAQVVHRALFSQTPHLQTASIAHHAGGQMQMGWQYHYFPNDPTRRQRRTDLVAQRPNWTWNYNPRGEVTTASRESIAGQTWSYQYDAIGNRTSMKRSAAWVTSPDGTPSVSSVSQADGAAFERVTATVANALNQIVAVDRPQSVELNGIASALATLELQATPQPSAQIPEPAAVIAALPPNQNRPPASGEPDGWSHWLGDTGTASFGQWPKVKVKATTQSETLGTLVDEVEGRVWIKPDESPVYDPRGNLIQDGGWIYEWDARNRLLAAEMRPQHLPNDLPQIRVEHRYDWMSRRVVTITKEKRVEAATGDRETVWRVLEHRHFWYDGWHLMAETVQTGATGSVATVTQRYIWGLDLAGDWERGMGQTRPQGSSTRTGGVGALLGVITSAGKTYSVCNDANGNVMGFIDLETATLTARFDYDAFGNQITNWTAPNHPAPDTISRVRFSSKHQDPHTGLVYYGYRWYDAENGRWPNRDPIGEQGGVNLYGFVGNDGVNQSDYLGMVAVTAIPGIMRANGMTNGAALMDHWFAGSSTTEKTTIKMSWVLGYRRAKSVWDKIINEKLYVNDAAKKEIVAMLKRTGKYTSGGDFGTLSGDAETLDKDSIQFREVGSLTDPIDDMFAALGKFTLRVLVKGYACVEPGNVNIRIDKIGIYVKDSYDFTGFQPLGFWNSTTNYAGKNPLYGDYVSNADFRAHGGGKDFKVFSDIKIKTISPSEEFNDP